MPRGQCIGWVSGNDLFLEPEISYQVTRLLGGAETLQLSEQSLRRRLHDHGLLASTDPGREMLTIRRTLAGCPRQVLHLNAAALLAPKETQGAVASPPHTGQPSPLSGLSGHTGSVQVSKSKGLDEE